MGIVFLNNCFMPMAEAKISPLDRGFLFGDSIYEVIPSYQGETIGFRLHIERMQAGLSAIGIALTWSYDSWRQLCDTLIEKNTSGKDKNNSGNLGIYLQVSRGANTNRFHAYPQHIPPTIFAFTYEIPPPPVVDKNNVMEYKVLTSRDLRWKRCHIKSTSLLGNVMHFQDGYEQGLNETLLYNERHELTEASACNAYIVKQGVVVTPALDNQILAGVTRHILLDLLRKEGALKVEERVVMMDEVFDADEIWLTSSSKEVVPVTEIDYKPVGTGKVGDIWLIAQTIYSTGKFNY